jgi:hypothetical protein
MENKKELPLSRPDIHKYKYFICTDEKYHPMSWDGHQLCYNTSSYWQDTQWPIQIYSRRRAWELIQRTIKFRKKNKWPIQDYRFMPILVRSAKN